MGSQVTQPHLTSEMWGLPAVIGCVSGRKLQCLGMTKKVLPSSGQPLWSQDWPSYKLDLMCRLGGLLCTPHSAYAQVA